MGSENEETLATHPDPRQRTRRQVTDVTDPTRFQARTMKLRANRILSVGVLVLLGLVLVSTQVAESRPDPDPQDLNEGELDTLVPDRKLLSTQVQAESERFEAEPTRVLQGLPLYPPPSHGWLGGRRSLLGHGDEEVPLWVEDLPLSVLPLVGRRSLLGHRDEPRFCCRAFTAQCLACDAGMSLRKFYKKRRNKDISGCEKYHRGHGHGHGGKGKGDKGRGRWDGRRWWG